MSPASASSRKRARSPAASSLRKLGPEPCPEGLALLFGGQAAFLAENAANPASRQPGPASGLVCEAQITEPHLHAGGCQRRGAAHWFPVAGFGSRVPRRWWYPEPQQHTRLGAERSDHTRGGEWTDAVCPWKAARSEACAKARGFRRKSRQERNNASGGGALAPGRQFACRKVEGSPLALLPAPGSVPGAPLTQQGGLAKLVVGDC